MIKKEIRRAAKLIIEEEYIIPKAHIDKAVEHLTTAVSTINNAVKGVVKHIKFNDVWYATLPHNINDNELLRILLSQNISRPQIKRWLGLDENSQAVDRMINGYQKINILIVAAIHKNYPLPLDKITDDNGIKIVNKAIEKGIV
jgi:hypothetical protein